MANVTPGYQFLTNDDPITAAKLNLIAQPIVTFGLNEVGTANLGTVPTNTLLGRISTGTGDVEVIDLTVAGIGYRAGAGGTVTQGTSKSTGVTLSKVCGKITMDGASLAADTTVSFVLTNTHIAAGDVLAMNHVSGGTVGAYILNARCGSGTATIDVHNATPGSLGEAVVIQFVLIKAVTS